MEKKFQDVFSFYIFTKVYNQTENPPEKLQKKHR